MKSLNVVTGLPRSGSTLLCNILNQNLEFHASSTSTLPIIMANASLAFSSSVEIQGELIRDREATELRMCNSLRAFANAWHSQDKIIFDKSRGWASHTLLLQQLFPESLSIIMVRDLRAVFGSVEKQHRVNPILDLGNTPQEKTIFTRADKMFSPQGLIGGPIVGIEDVLRRNLNKTMIVQYEAFCENPGMVLERIYSKLSGVSYFEHDFTDVQKTAEEVDALYLHKFPHEGSGKVEPTDPNEWRTYVSPDLANTIFNRYPFYNQRLGYTE